jgi:tetratricopeptide (TPR) repeat protein
VAAAQRLGRPDAEAMARRILALAWRRLGRHSDTRRQLERALDLYHRVGHQNGQACVHADLSEVLGAVGAYAEALEHSRTSLAMHRAAADNQYGEAAALDQIGWLYSKLGEHQHALAYCRQALNRMRELGNRAGEAETLASLGHAHHQLGHHAEAIDCYLRALDLFREVGDRRFEATALTAIGDIHHANGDDHAARDAWRHALAILEQLDHPDAEWVRAKLDGAGSSART